MTPAINPTALVPVGKVLLLGGFGYCLVRAMHGRIGLEDAFGRFIIGFLSIAIFTDVASSMDGISHQFSDMIRRLGDQDDLKKLILEAFKSASQEGNPNGGFNIPAILEQAWRTGVWGIMSQIVDWVFLTASFLLECGHEVLWQLLLFLAPLAAGVFPIFPRILSNVALYAVELSLWFPFLALIEIVTGLVARQQMTKAGSWGLYVVAIEILAILLTLMIPSFTHRFLNGAFSGDLDSTVRIMRWVTGGATRYAQTAASAARGKL